MPVRLHTRAMLSLVGLLVGAAPLVAQSCPKQYSDAPQRRVEVHIFQPSCDTPLLPGKRAVVRVWAMWPPAEDAGETDSAFNALITIRDGNGGVLVNGAKHTFHRPPWQGSDMADAIHTYDAIFVPDRGSFTSLKVSIEPDPDYVGPSERAPNLFPDPGVASWELVPAETFGTSGENRVLHITYVAPLVGNWKNGGAISARTWVNDHAADAETFLIQNFPVHDVRRGGLVEVPFDEPEIVSAPCPSSAGATCRFYDGLAINERVEDRLARLFAEQSARSIVVMFLPPGYAGDRFRGKTFHVSAGTRATAFAGGLSWELPDAPVVILPADTEPWALAHEVAHAFLEDEGHLDLPSYQRYDPERRMAIPTGRSEGIHAFRIPLHGNTGMANKHSEEGNGEHTNLVALLKEDTETDGLRKRFVADVTYAKLLQGVRDAPSGIWAAAPAPAEGVRRAAAQRPSPPGNDLNETIAGPSAEPVEPYVLPPPKPTVRPTEYLLVGGAVGENGGAVLDAPRFIALEGHREGEGVGPYRIELQGADGGVLAGRSFSLNPVRVWEPDERVIPGSVFSLLFPVPDGLHRIVLVDDAGRELATLERRGPPPELRLRSVRPNHDAATLAIQWESTAAAATVHYDVSYSPDGRSDWTVVAHGVTASTVELDTRGLRRGPEPRIRVSASNGFDRAVVESPVELRRFDVLTRYPAPDRSADAGQVWASLNTDLPPDVALDDRLALRDSRGRRIAATVGYDPDAARLWLVPDSALEQGSTFEVTVSRDLRDRWGRTLGRDATWTFMTAPDERPPRVLSTHPRNGDITIPPNVVLSVTFDEPLADGAARAGAVRLATVNGEVVAGEVRLDSGGRRLTLTPSSDLQRRTSYTLTLDATLADQFGNRLGESMPITFTTAGHIVPGGL